MPFLVLSLFFVDPAPLEMPRAESYLVEEDGRTRLEDRYDRTDLWISQAVLGRWTDEDGRVFTLATLDFAPPGVAAHATETRGEFVAGRMPMKRIRANGKPPKAFRQAIGILSDTTLTDEKPRTSRQIPHGYRDVCYWQHPTNYSTIVCAFRREKEESWHLATWHLAAGDDYPERMQAFEDRFLRKDYQSLVTRLASSADGGRKTEDARREVSERELLRADVKHAVAAYPNWHTTDAEEFTVVDALQTRAFVDALTNDFATMRARYAAALPTPLDGSNTLCVARIYASREDYLDALEIDGLTNMTWSAAYWSPVRRELVAYLPPNGEAELLKTIRHEALHQYLSYAASMIPVSPWLNEGYAQYFEDSESADWGADFDLSEEKLEALAKILPGVFGMDYEQFYEGTDFERRLKYRLAWSVVFFLEKGADRVRFRPFARLKRDYFGALIRTRDMRQATSAAFGKPETLKLFVAEWQKFWKNR